MRPSSLCASTSLGEVFSSSRAVTSASCDAAGAKVQIGQSVVELSESGSALRADLYSSMARRASSLLPSLRLRPHKCWPGQGGNKQRRDWATRQGPTRAAFCDAEADGIGLAGAWAAGADWPRAGETGIKTMDAAATVSQRGKEELFVFIIQGIPGRLHRLDGRTARSSRFKGG